MEPSAYAIWVLVLQVTAYMGFLDFGLQTAVARYIAFAEEKKDAAWRDGIFSTALAGLSAAALFGVLCLLALAAFAGSIFPSVPHTLLPSMRWAILIAGTSTAVGLPASAWNGVFVGLQRYEFPAVTISMGRLVTSIGLVLAAVSGKSLVFMACVVCGANLLTYASQFVLLRRLFPNVRFRVSLITGVTVRELSGYCASLTVWSFSTLLVTGFDLILVGRFEFSYVAIYSAAAVLITFLGGLQNSLFSVIMPHSAALQASGDAKALGNLLLKCTRLSTVSLLLTGLPLVLFSFPIIKIWLGQRYAIDGSSILVILVIGNMIRLLGLPYASILVGTGQQRLILLSPLIEGISNLVASIVLGFKFGAIGVAWGTFIGAVAGLLATVAYSVPRTRQWIDQSPIGLIKEILKVFTICCLPILLLLPFELIYHSRVLSLSIIAVASSMLICIVFALKSTLMRRSVNL
jgi:O-antigen/teichoic acid export membrane protein